jgi:hypothetical protein|tara:strand:- start:233 stop:364 length:132 start_codon:yes stop_codon:yes gene_type:complete
MSIEDKIKFVIIGENPNFKALELKAEIIKKWSGEDDNVSNNNK